MRVALVGNPNSGKTTLFNALTGSSQRVGNWPGVTVEKKEGKLKSDKSVEITDLPGIYSLSPYTLEEVVARNYIVAERPDVILNIIDGSNLERNLYLTTQLLELGLPMLVAVNMMDVVRKNGDELSTEKLGEELGCKVIEISALKNEGIGDIPAALAEVSGAQPAKPMDFSAEIESAIAEVSAKLPNDIIEPLKRFYAIKLLEGDDKIGEGVSGLPDVTAQQEAVEAALDDNAESCIINDRYTWIGGIIDDVRVKGKSSSSETISDKIDSIVTNRILALPIFIVIMFFVYYISVSTVGAVATDWANDGVFGDGWYLDPSPIVGIDGSQAAYDEVAGEYEDACSALEAGVGGEYDAYDDETGEDEIIQVDQETYNEALTVVAQYGEDGETFGESGPEYSDYGIWIPGIPALLDNLWEAIGLDPDGWLYALIMDGIVAGVGAMLGFLPQMFILFILLSLLEQCGYISRVAFILDRIFRRFGLSGKSFIPLLIGMGCGVPGVSASRTIENINDRRMTVMTTTFIPCGAKIPFIALIAAAVFGGVWWVAPSAYFLGIVAVLCSGIILKKMRFFSGEATPFVMELPAYHIPTFSGVMRSTGERCAAFAKKAVTILLVASIMIWFLQGYGFVDGAFGAVEDQADSLLAMVGGAIAVIFAPLGWGDWQAAAAAVTGIMAKEEIVSTLGILYAGAEGGWYAGVQAAFPLAAGYSFLAFNLLCIPCFAAMAAILREMGSLKWAAAAWGYECGLAWVVSFIIYQLGGLATGEVAFGVGPVIAIIAVIAIIYLLFRPNKNAQPKVASSDLAGAEA